MYSALTVRMMKLFTIYLIKFLKREIHKTLGAAIFFAIVFNVSTARCEEKRFAFQFVVKFSSNISTAIGVHERSHILSENLTNADMEREDGNRQQPIAFTENADVNVKGFPLNSTGLIGQETGSGVISQFDKIDKDDSSVQRLKRWKIVDPIRYALDHWFSGITNKKEGNTYRGDLQGIEHYSNKTTSNEVGLSIASMSMSQGYRFLQTQNWAPDWIKKETHHLSFSLTPDGGISATYRISF